MEVSTSNIAHPPTGFPAITAATRSAACRDRCAAGWRSPGLVGTSAPIRKKHANRKRCPPRRDCLWDNPWSSSLRNDQWQPSRTRDLGWLGDPQLSTNAASGDSASEIPDRRSGGTAVSSTLPKPTRQRNKTHLAFVASQPCLICQRTPCDAHHIKFAEP